MVFSGVVSVYHMPSGQPFHCVFEYLLVSFGGLFVEHVVVGLPINEFACRGCPVKLVFEILPVFLFCER
jgi:hypothetical protein